MKINEETRNIIKNSLCPLNQWIKDIDIKNCFKCDKRFHSLYRRKHHCRYCGQVFCNICSDFYLDGKDLSETQKKIRMCKLCHQKCWKYISKHDEKYVQYRKSGELTLQGVPKNIQQIQQNSKPSSFTQIDKLGEIKSILEEYQINDMLCIESLSVQVRQKFSILLQVICKQANIPLQYLQYIKTIANYIVKKLPSNAMITNKMNICENIKIKCFYQEKFQMQVQSIVLVKKICNNKKIKMEYNNVNCILIYGNIQSQDLVGEASFENMMNNRLKQVHKIIKYCQRVRISLIFIEGIIQKQFQNIFNEKQIIIISKIPIQHLYRLKISLKIDKVVESIDKVYEYPQKQIKGEINSMIQATYYSIKKQQNQQKYFKINSHFDQLGLTLLILGSNVDLLEKLKKNMKVVLQLLQHMLLKVHQVSLDHNLLESMSQDIKNDCYLHNFQMFFHFYKQHHSDLLNYLRQKYVSYTKICYVEHDLINYPEVTYILLEQYLKTRKHSFRKRWDNYTQICGNIRNQHCIFYSDDDQPLGQYILQKFMSLDKKCTNCNKPFYLHIDVFYSTDQYIKVSTESRIIDSQQFQNWDKGCNNLEDSKIQMEMIFSQMSKKQVKGKLYCFIQCNKCQQLLSSKVKVGREYLEYSFTAFLNYMFKGSSETFIRANNLSFSINQKNSSCSHSEKIRVFQMGDKLLKFRIGKYTIGRHCVMTETGLKTYLQQKQFNYLIQNCLLKRNSLQQILNYLFNQIRKIAEMVKNPQYESMRQNPRQSFISARKSILNQTSVRLSQAQCMDMIIPELLEQLNSLKNLSKVIFHPKRMKDFLAVLKHYHIFINMLKKSYLIIAEVYQSAKKRQLDKKYQTKDFMEFNFQQSIDMNSFIDSNSSILGSIQNESKEQFDCNQQYIVISRIKQYSVCQTNDVNKQYLQLDNYSFNQPNLDKQPMGHLQDRRTERNWNKAYKIDKNEVFKIFKNYSSILQVQNAYLDYLPCYPHQSSTLIASAINSSAHKKCLQNSDNFLLELTISMNKFLQNEMKTDNQQILKMQNILNSYGIRFNIDEKLKKSDKSINYEVVFLYPHDFHIQRQKKNISLQMYIRSIIGAEKWKPFGGKSGASFLKSFDDVLILKKITVKQYIAFKRLLPRYFTHLNQGSLLTPIYGAYTVIKNNNAEHFVVMSNLFFGMKEWHLYDFKGSITRRFSSYPNIPLDINFLIDRNSQPIFCKDNVLKNLQRTLEYLSQNNIIDYSLILVVEVKNSQHFYLDGNRFQIGIVDYIRQFKIPEIIENLFKGPQATVIQPQQYKERMLKSVRKYFTQIPL